MFCTGLSSWLWWCIYWYNSGSTPETSCSTRPLRETLWCAMRPLSSNTPLRSSSCTGESSYLVYQYCDDIPDLLKLTLQTKSSLKYCSGTRTVTGSLEESLETTRKDSSWGVRTLTGLPSSRSVPARWLTSPGLSEGGWDYLGFKGKIRNF